jgi:N utilization substance protein A
VAPGAPVSVLLEYGMSDAVSEKLAQAGVGTIERLGTMTPEQLEAIPGIDPASVEFIQASVVAYYSQFEDPAAEGGEPAEGSSPASEAEETILSGPADEGGEPVEPAEPAGAPAEPEAEAVAGHVVEAAPPMAEDLVEKPPEVVSGEGPETVEQSGTIGDAGSPHNHAEGTGAESVPKNSSGE